MAAVRVVIIHLPVDLLPANLLGDLLHPRRSDDLKLVHRRIVRLIELDRHGIGDRLGRRLRNRLCRHRICRSRCFAALLRRFRRRGGFGRRGRFDRSRSLGDEAQAIFAVTVLILVDGQHVALDLGTAQQQVSVGADLILIGIERVAVGVDCGLGLQDDLAGLLCLLRCGDHLGHRVPGRLPVADGLDLTLRDLRHIVNVNDLGDILDRVVIGLLGDRTLDGVGLVVARFLTHVDQILAGSKLHEVDAAVRLRIIAVNAAVGKLNVNSEDFAADRSALTVADLNVNVAVDGVGRELDVLAFGLRRRRRRRLRRIRWRSRDLNDGVRLLGRNGLT